MILLLAACGAGHDSADHAEIRAVMMREWNKPEAPLTVDPIVVVGTFAIADWTQPSLGGRALLQRSGDTWTVVLCAGDSLKDAVLLEHAGMSGSDAEALLRSLSAAEASLPAERRARIAGFKGVVRMGSDGHGASTR